MTTARLASANKEKPAKPRQRSAGVSRNRMENQLMTRVQQPTVATRDVDAANERISATVRQAMTDLGKDLGDLAGIVGVKRAQGLWEGSHVFYVYEMIEVAKELGIDWRVLMRAYTEDN